jgi:hypothetical protein
MLCVSARGEDGWRSRRSFLKASLLAGGALGAQALSPARAARASADDRDTAVIQIWLGGGPSHIDMVDLKPEAPLEFRGAFSPIATSVPGIQICELLPKHAARMGRLAIIRSLHHATSDHPAGTHWTQTGRIGVISNIGQPTHPSAGSIAARALGPRREGMAPYVHIAPDPMGFPIFLRCHEAAYLGSQYAPLLVKSARKLADTARVSLDNMIGKVQFETPDFAPAPGLDLGRLENRVALNRRLDGFARLADKQGDVLAHYQRQALALVTSGAAREAFDLEREPGETRERYGMNAWGQGALLCRRLVEAGARFVTLNTDSFSGQWDNHGNLPGQFAEMLPVYDQMIAALLDDLESRGMTGKVLVLLWGEFGRTPKINTAAGRDHWGMSGFAMLAGGGLRTGQVIGSTTSKGEEPKDRPIGPCDVLATVYHVLGIDPEMEFADLTGRPIKILNEGQAITELL